MQAGRSFLRKLRLPSPILNFAAQKGLCTPASLSHAPEQQVFGGYLYSSLRKLRLRSSILILLRKRGLRTPASLSHAPEQQVFRGCLHTGNSSKGAPCRPPASYVSAANSALDLDLFPSALHSQVSRRALFAPALPFPIRRMQTIEKRRYLGSVFCFLMYPLRFSSERKRVCMADGNDSARCKTAQRLTVRTVTLA